MKHVLNEGDSYEVKSWFLSRKSYNLFSLEFHMKLYEMAVSISIDIGLPLGIHDRTWLKFLYLYGDKTLRGKCTFTMP